MTRILIADDHAVVRSGVRCILADHPGWNVVPKRPRRTRRSVPYRAAEGSEGLAQRPSGRFRRCRTGTIAKR